MRMAAVIVLVVVLVFAAMAAWVVLLVNLSSVFPSIGIATPTPYPTYPAYPTPTPYNQAPTPTPAPTWHPTTGTTNAAVPDYTVRYVDHSYDVPPTYKTDPYTGKTVLDRSGYHVDNRTIEVTIQNQPFTPSVSPDGNTTALYFNVRSKGHYEDWNTASSYNNVNEFQASASGQTVISFFMGNWNIPPGGQVDFQVQTLIGYSYSYISGPCGESTSRSFVTVSQSDWSSTQTVTVPNSTP